MGKGRVRPQDEWDENQYAYKDEYDEPPVRQVRRRPQRPQNTQRVQRHYAPGPPRTPYPTRTLRTPPPRRRRSVWPILLGGCAIGIFLTVAAAAAVVFFTFRASQGSSVPVIGGIGGGGTQTFTHEDTQQVTLPSLTQMQICDKIGNVSVAVDPNSDAATVTTTKIVHTGSKADANQEFGRIGVSVQQSATSIQNLSCAQASSTAPTPSTTPTSSGNGNGILSVNTNIPDSDGLIHGSSNAVDIRILLAPKFLSGASAPLQLNIEAAVGNVTVDGLSGLLNIKGSSGNVKVTHATLISGSSISTGQGDVAFNGILAAPSDTTTQANFIIRDETGKLDVTLPSTTNVVLSANTNVGTIHSDFAINATNSSGSASYRGPLNSSAAAQSAAVLTLDVSTGDIYIHKRAG